MRRIRQLNKRINVVNETPDPVVTSIKPVAAAENTGLNVASGKGNV